MDRRSWLWRRMLSEKNLGEIESSGSMSSHSDRFSDDQVYPTQTTPSPEGTGEAAPNDEVNDKAENELLILKQQLDDAKQENSVLEDQVSHLNDALKECMRDLQQAKEEQEQKIHEALTNNSYGLESKRPDHEWKVVGAASSVHLDLQQRLGDKEKDNSSLKIELQSQLEELKFRTIEGI
ncbi:hypothetical protein JHK85_044043 [Glycine max]|nr:hypothetical protein JHK85_044043 [Glycine max]